MSNLNITITEAAQVYLRELLAKQNSDGIAVRIFVENAGTPKAECCMAYCTQGEDEKILKKPCFSIGKYQLGKTTRKLPFFIVTHSSIYNSNNKNLI